ncbi:MAG: hypothetical protein DI585_05760 [Pseudomonas fluorescens]|nr:MAG: hypothetical protein DI585_05760 [Pseudomonas fluorescens]
MRSLTLMGLVLLLMVVSGDAFAQMPQYITVGTDALRDLGFPYLSPAIDQRNILINAFSFQMSLFGAISGTTGDAVPALTILAATAVLVGALMIIFNPKHRKAPVLGTWLLLVIITLFAPFGSKYLFYPLTGSAVRGLDAATGGSSNGRITDCNGNNYIACGFTPQLVGVHIASVLQLTLSDMFMSRQWKGLIEQSLAEKSLLNDARLDVGNAWLMRLNTLQSPSNCGGGFSWNKQSVYRADPSSSWAQENDMKYTYTMASEWANLREIFGRDAEPGNMNSFRRDLTSAPPTIVLYDESDFPWSGGGTTGGASSGEINGRQNGYANGINSIYSALVDGAPGVSFNAQASGTISIKDALDDLESKGFFKAVRTECSLWSDYLNPWGDNAKACGIRTGLIFTRNTLNADDQGNNADSMRKCYYDRGNCFGTGSWLGPVKQANAFREILQSAKAKYVDPRGTMNATVSSGANDPFLWELMKVRDDGGADLLSSQIMMTMPVGFVHYSPPTEDGGEAVRTGGKPRTEMSCFESLNDLTNEAINKVFGPNSKMRDMQPLQKLLVDQRALPAASEPLLRGFNENDVYDAGIEAQCRASNYDESGTMQLINCVDFAGKQFMTMLETAFMQRAKDRLIQLKKLNPSHPDTLSPEERYQVMLTLVMDAIHSSTVARRSNDAEKAATDATTKIDLVGLDGLTSFGGAAATMFGQVLAKIGATFTGPLASAIVYFMNILVNMALLIIIVLTPILFVIGLAMPGAAMGMLTIAVLGAFILKLTPVTLLVLNNIGGMVYDMIGAGGEANKGVMQDLMILAMAGLYANVVGLTFFLLFKLGDASTVLSRFTAIDGSAKQIADKGWDMTKAAALLAATTVGTAVTGGIGGLIGRAQLGGAAARAQGELTDAQRAAQMGGNRDEPNPDDPNTAPGTGDGPSGGGAGGAANQVAAAEDLLDSQPKTQEEIAQANYEERMRRSEIGAEAFGQELRNRALGLGGSEGDARPQVSLNEQQLPDGQSLAIPNTTGASEEGDDLPPAMVSSSGAPILGGGSGGAAAGSVGGATANQALGAGGRPPAGSQQEMVQQRLNQIQADRTAQNVSSSMSRLQAMANDTSLKPETRAEAQRALNMVSSQMTDESIRDANQVMAQALDTHQDGMTMQMYEGRQVRRANLEHDVAARLASFNAQYGARMDDLSSRKARGISLTQSEETELANMKTVVDDLNSINTTELVMGDIDARLGATDRLRTALDVRANADKLPSYKASFASGVYGAFAGTGGGLTKIPVIGPMIAETLNERHQAPERARAWAAAGGYGKWSKLQSSAKRMGFYQKEMAPIAAGTQYEAMLVGGGFQAQADIARQGVIENVARSRSLYDAMVASRTVGSIDKFKAEINDDQKFKASATNRILNTNPSLKVNSDEFNKAMDKEFQTELTRRFENSIDMDKNPNFKAYLDIGELEGLGRIQSADRVHSIRTEAQFAQGAVYNAKRLKGGGNRLGDLTPEEMLAQGKVEVETVGVALTPELLNRKRSAAAVRSFDNTLENVLVDNYGVVEKLHIRNDPTWNAARDMEFDANAARAFSMANLDNDYVVLGHIKMVQGKQTSMGYAGAYNTMVELRNESNKLISSHIDKARAAGDKSLLEAMDKAAQKVTSGNQSDINAAARIAAEKWAKSDLARLNVNVPMESVFVEAKTSAAAKLRQTVEVAPDNMAAQAMANRNAAIKVAGAAYMDTFNNSPEMRGKLGTTLNMIKNGRTVNLGTVSESLARANREISEQNRNQLDAAMKSFIQAHPDALVVSHTGSGKNRVSSAYIEQRYTDELKKFYTDALGGPMSPQAEANFRDRLKDGKWLIATTDD